MSRVVVFGSANADLVLHVEQLPGPGQTILATKTRRVPGGKGANQAIAAARSGAATAFIGAVCADEDGTMLGEALRSSGVDVTGLREVVAPTGLAVVTVAPDGENSIVVAPGANALLTDVMGSDRALLESAGVLLAQLEVPLDGVSAAAHVAHRHGVPVLLNAAPSRRLPEQIWACIDVLIVNEHEAADLLGHPDAVGDPDRAVVELLKWAPRVLITLGPDGSRYAARDGQRVSVAAPHVDAVDTTAAGDTFCGVLAAGWAARVPIGEAMRRATAAAALCVQAYGAVPSIPTGEQIDAFAEELAGR
jgi:ribokinase